MKTLQTHIDHLRRSNALELPATISEMVEQAARRFGDAQAVCFFEDDRCLSFRELDLQVKRLAHSLHGIGVKHGSHVAVMLPNRIEFPLVWLALARLGAVMTPVITRLTPREIEFVLTDADISHLIMDQQYRPVLESISGGGACPPANRTVVVGGQALDGQHEFDSLLEAGRADFVPDRRPAPSDLLSIQYTSGTTGMPKGVMLSHHFWVQAGCAPIVMWGLQDVRSILSDHPFYYIDPQWMLVAGLYIGARVDFSKGMSVSRFMGWVRDRRSELAWFPDPLLKTPLSESDRVHSVKLFLAYHFSSEMILEATRRYGTRFREAYGMTEIAMGLGVPWEIDDVAIIGTCGLPGPWRECRIVDEAGHDVASGSTGELWVRGSGICAGYYKRPEANAAAFVDGWFRTGDLFTQDANGYYRIVGRLKDMIKRSGENIAASEVERVLLELDAVIDAAVVPVPDSQRDEEVKAYLRLRDGLTPKDLPPLAVLEHCRSRLASFKLPRYLAYVDSLPYTASEKVAKSKLTAGCADLRTDAYDAVEGIWR